MNVAETVVIGFFFGYGLVAFARDFCNFLVDLFIKK